MKNHLTVVRHPVPEEDQSWAPSPDPEIEYMLSLGMTKEEIFAREAEIFERYWAARPGNICVMEWIPLLNLPPHVSRRSVAALLSAKLLAHAGRAGMRFYTSGRFRLFPIDVATKLALQWHDELVAKAKRIKRRPDLSVVTGNEEEHS